MAWNCEPETLKAARAIKYVPRRDGQPIPYRDVLNLWSEDEAFAAFFTSLLAAAPFEGFRWETPPISQGNTDRPFEFVLLDGPGLDRPPEPDAFAGQFASAREGQAVVAFENLGRDAMLVVPCPGGPERAYVHLATFVREAPPTQVQELWRTVGESTAARLGQRPLWLSTAGLGVAWLHVRIDSRPKYYGFQQYRMV